MTHVWYWDGLRFVCLKCQTTGTEQQALQDMNEPQDDEEEMT